jgi:hypothetical protein
MTEPEDVDAGMPNSSTDAESGEQDVDKIPRPDVSTLALSMPQMRQELISIRGLLAI